MLPDFSDERVNRLFHDAEQKFGGVDFARNIMHHEEPAKVMEAEGAALLLEAGATLADWDGDQFCILFGPNLQEGEAFFGKTATDALQKLYGKSGVI